MAVYTYTDDIKDINTLQQALTSSGVYDAKITVTINGSKTTTVDTASDKLIVDSAVATSSVGGLLYVKATKIDEIEERTEELSTLGATFTRPSDGAIDKGPLEVSRIHRGNLRDNLLDHADGLYTFPQIIATTNGRGVELFSVADLQAALEAVVLRGLYLLNDGINQDGSSGETKLIKDTLEETTISGVEAITDLRL